jgi:6-phosphogluconolactonase
MTMTSHADALRLVAFVGTYPDSAADSRGGIHVVEVSRDGRQLKTLSRTDEPQEAGFLLYAPTTRTLYAVDERKNDGRGPVEPPAAVHAFSVDATDGVLTWLNSQIAPGPRPTFLSINEDVRLLVCANHGDFQHVERVVTNPDGTWDVEYLYDDSAVIVYRLEQDGRLGSISDLKVMTGHGPDPNDSPQNGGHAQASSHAHCAVIDPSGRYVVVCDKGTDLVTVFTLGATLEIAATLQLAAGTGPRHLAFDPTQPRAYLTCEFASDLASVTFDPATGAMTLIDRVSTVASDHDALNEPAELRVHPAGRLVYVNNRGEDSLAWFEIDDSGSLKRQGHVPLAASMHPGLAARSFTFDPTGSFILLADRPAGLIRSFAVDPTDGSLTALTEHPVPSPAYVAIAEL